MTSYQPHHRLRDILSDNSLLLPVLSRFGISLGFGNSTVEDVCTSRGVDTDTFLAVANFISGKPFDAATISLKSLTAYLKAAHAYFLDYLLPGIRKRLLESISSSQTPDVALLILRFYDQYADEVRRHMEYENSVVFSYVSDLLDGRSNDAFSLTTFKDTHGNIAEKLKEIKEILICHFTTDDAHVDRLNSLLFDIVICERDLIAHCGLEDSLFVPTLERMESHAAAMERRREVDKLDTPAPELDANGDIMLTPRERDIIAAIARGLSNKEIADNLCLSVYTVATHRRNICAKLNIHSASGMTIYAILHGLISIDEGEQLIHK